MMRARLLLLCGLWCLVVSVHAAPGLRDASDVNLRLADTEDPAATKVYIVQLSSPSAAERHATATKRALGPVASAPRARFDRESPAVQSYVAQIEYEQERIIARTGPGVEKVYSYRYGLNGFAARMTPAQAQRLENLPEVLKVWEDEVRPLATQYSPSFLGLFDSENGLRSVEGLDGDGVVGIGDLLVLLALTQRREALSLVHEFLGDDGFVMYLGDNLLEQDLAAFVAAFETARAGADPAAAQILLKQVPDPHRFGVATLDEEGHVTGTLAQRRHMQWHHVLVIEEILLELEPVVPKPLGARGRNRCSAHRQSRSVSRAGCPGAELSAQ